ncbi:MAG: sugar phosphate isomerase/epimerase [Victivallales bacterium]|nr:sugar phosphate isomerase/epimerase [Victivallales bacterium]
MDNIKYSIALGMGFEESIEEQIGIAAKAGFQAIATDWKDGDDVASWGKIVKDNGLEYNYLHAPFGEMHTVWEADSAGDSYTDMLIRGLDACVSAGTQNYVCHVIIGMDRHSPSEIAVPRLQRLLDEAAARNVLVAFENTEGLEYLEMVMRVFADHPACRFCWDTGHELCYNHAQDVMAMFGDRLSITHLDDNFGMTDPNLMTWHDDAHVMPGDGIADWPGIVRRLRLHDFKGIYNLELNRFSRPERNTHAKYANMSCLEFMRTALASIKRFVQQ